MGRARMTQVQRNPITGKWVLRATPRTETSYLGGLTFPWATKRPHMGPFNAVSGTKISDADETYRQHDLGYKKELQKGRNPYTSWNKYDQRLMDAPSLGWADYAAKGLFGAKRFFTYGVPDVKNTSVKNVYGNTNVSRKRDFDSDYKNPNDGKVYGATSNDLDVSGAAQAWARKGSRTSTSAENSAGVGSGSGRRNIRSTIRYTRY